MASTAKAKQPVLLQSVKTECDDAEEINEINIFVSENGEFVTEQIDVSKVKVEPDDSKIDEVPVITIHVPADVNDTYSPCDVELKYVPKSLIPNSNIHIKKQEEPEPVFLVSPNLSKQKSKTPVPIKKVQPAAPKGSQTLLAPKKSQQLSLLKPAPSNSPVWRRLTPKPPGAVSNYYFPHELRSNRTRLIIDCPTNIPVTEFKSQLSDTADIVTSMDLAPASKKKVKELNTNSVSKLFAYPGKSHLSPTLRRLYQRHLTSKITTHEPVTDLNLQSLDPNQPVRTSRALNGAVRNQKSAAPAKESPAKKRKSDNEVEPKEQQVVRFFIKGEGENAETQEIIVLHDGVDVDHLASDSMQSIEMILAAAEGGDVVSGTDQVFICDGDAAQYIIVQNEGSAMAVEEEVS